MLFVLTYFKLFRDKYPRTPIKIKSIIVHFMTANTESVIANHACLEIQEELWIGLHLSLVHTFVLAILWIYTFYFGIMTETCKK